MEGWPPNKTDLAKLALRLYGVVGSIESFVDSCRKNISIKGERGSPANLPGFPAEQMAADAAVEAEELAGRVKGAQEAWKRWQGLFDRGEDFVEAMDDPRITWTADVRRLFDGRIKSDDGRWLKNRIHYLTFLIRSMAAIDWVGETLEKITKRWDCEWDRLILLR